MIITYRAILLLGLMLLGACGEAGKDKNMVGKWRLVFDREACLQKMPAELRKTFNAQPQAQQEAILKDIREQLERDNWIEFRTDQSFEQVLLEGETKHIGKWEIKGGGTQVLLKWQKNKEDKTPQRETCKIVRLEKNSLILETNDKTVKRLSFVPYSSKPNPKNKKQTITPASVKK